MAKIKIPHFLKPNKNYELTRIGKNNDGGYLVCKNSLKKSKFLLSMGINDDWSFEKQFSLKNKYLKIKMYDQTLSFYFLIHRFFIEILKLFLPGRIKKFNISIKNLHEYFSFVRNKFVNKVIDKNNFKKIIQIKSKNIFLKIDIEGSEYEILDTIIDNKNKIEAIAIEFHDLHNNIKKIENFVKKLNLKIVHIHPNNFKQINPDILEVTFSRNPKVIGKKFLFPNNLDMKNDPRQKNLDIIFL